MVDTNSLKSTLKQSKAKAKGEEDRNYSALLDGDFTAEFLFE